jgi:hypothetical protein
MILGHFAAAGAAQDAREAITDGKVTFTPNFGLMGHGPGMGMGMGLGMGMDMRF